MRSFYFLILLSTNIYAATVNLAVGPGISNVEGEFFNLVGGNDATNERATEQVQATIRGKDALWAAFGFNLVPAPIWKKNKHLQWLRWSLEFNWAFFRAKEQEINRLPADEEGKHHYNLGTASKGWIAALTPAVVFFVGDADHFAVFAGVGFGVGFARLEGNYYVTDGNAASQACQNSVLISTVQENCEINNYNVKALSIGFGALAGISWNKHWDLRLTGGGPKLGTGGTRMSATTYTLGLYYKFKLHL